MTNQDIASQHGVTFQKVQQLIKTNGLNANELRRVDKYIVYLHLIDGEVVYVGSGKWYRMRRSSTRRNLEHKSLMEKRKLQYKVVAEFDVLKEARLYEEKLILRYRSLGQAKYNFKYDGARDEISRRGYTSNRKRRSKTKGIEVLRYGKFYGSYNFNIDFAREISDEPEKLLSGISTIIHQKWKPEHGPLKGFEINIIDDFQS